MLAASGQGRIRGILFRPALVGDQVEAAGDAVNSLRDTLGGLQGHVAQLGANPANSQLPMAILGQYMREEAVFAAYRDLFLIGGIISVVAVLPVFLLSGRRRSAA